MAPRGIYVNMDAMDAWDFCDSEDMLHGIYDDSQERGASWWRVRFSLGENSVTMAGTSETRPNLFPPDDGAFVLQDKEILESFFERKRHEKALRQDFEAWLASLG